MPDWIELLQWPAMLATVLAAWLVASSHDGLRHAGFWVFLLSNLLWVVWPGTAAPRHWWCCRFHWR